MINVYGHFFSMPANKVRLCISFLKLPHEYHHVDLQKGEHKSAVYLQINPAGRVPAIEDDGFKLSQSDAICKYLCALSGPSSFYPEDIQEQARVNEWIDFASQQVLHAMARLFFNRVIVKFTGEEPDERSIATGLSMLGRDLELAEKQLQDNDYLLGDKITLADVTLIAALEPTEMVQFDLSAYPSIERWRKTVMNREFYKRVHEKFGAEMTA